MPHSRITAPQRLQMPDSLGRVHTLGSGAEAFALWRFAPANRRLLVLGLGPYTAEEHAYHADIAAHYDDVLWLECPAFSAALAGNLQGQQPLNPRLPAHWRQISPQQALHEAAGRDMRLYRQNARLFPEFWGPLWGEIQRQALGLPLCPVAAPTVVLLSDAQALLTRELTQAFSEAGLTLHTIPTDPQAATALSHWQKLLQQQRPALVFSVNAQGLDAGGEVFHLLQACHVPVALWFVDNPWHILTRLRVPWWREAQLFCTDASFVEPLRAAGARQVAHVPLAAAQHMWEATPSATADSPCPHGTMEKLLFVGRLAFPQRQAFFGAARVPNDILQQAFALLEQGGRPDALWWTQHLGLTPADLWPGNAVRAVGLGAEECALHNRLLWLKAASACGLKHYGHSPEDAHAWQFAQGATAYMPTAMAQAHPPVDYYTTLPRLYATAPYTLNVTSLLLPHGLTQRHFDVWAAGGFLLTDNTAGLDIFPPELVAEIRLFRPQDLAARLHHLDAQPALRQHLQKAWQEHIRHHHSYACRIAHICTHMGITV